jgi:hypothetical protein
MSQTLIEQLDELNTDGGPQAVIERLIAALREDKQYHRLFDALLLKKKYELHLPLVQPTSFDDVPEERRQEFEQCYIAAAREVGGLFLRDERIGDAWVYFRTIREPAPVAAAIDAADIRDGANAETEQLIQIGLYEGANPVKGLEILLRTHGTCNTVTALDQHMPQLSPADRRRAAALLVREVYRDLKHTLQHEVQNKLAMTPPSETIRELIAGRDWLFSEGNYHIDVSHLHAVVRFARALDGESPELPLALQLAEYGSRLAAQFQYPGDPPFDDFYPAHVQFFRALLGERVDEAIAYFREKLATEPDEDDKPMIAYVLVDLLTRIGRLADAVPIAEKYLRQVEQAEFSFARLCHQAGALDTLREVARGNDDAVTYTAALLDTSARAP